MGKKLLRLLVAAPIVAVVLLVIALSAVLTGKAVYVEVRNFPGGFGGEIGARDPIPAGLPAIPEKPTRLPTVDELPPLPREGRPPPGSGQAAGRP